MKQILLIAAVAVLIPAALIPTRSQAQLVGYPPEASPFRDLEYRMGVSLFTGYLNAGNDPVGVAPQSGPMIGARYDFRVGGPAILTARLATASSNRTIINPTAVEGARVVGERSEQLLLADAGFALSLTGARSYRRLVPQLSLGLGAVSNFRDADVGGFTFGTTFAITPGASVLWVPDSRWHLRADLTDYLYQVRYPATYFIPASDGTQVRTGRQNVWTHNPAVSVGVSYNFLR